MLCGYYTNTLYYKDFPVYNQWLVNAHRKRISIDAALKSTNETSNCKDDFKCYNFLF